MSKIVELAQAVENELNKIGFYLCMIRHLKNVNYFYIVKDNIKNKILYNNSGTLAFINSKIKAANAKLLVHNC